MSNINIQYFKTSFGELLIGDFENKICVCDWRYRKMRSSIDKRIQDGLKAEYVECDSPLLKQLRTELEAYFNGERKEFEIPLLFVGTDFQKQVWEELLKIPFGKTQSYLELSQQLNNEKAIRAIASANGANAISIIVPCHRIIGSKGELVGYAGGLSTKKKLLKLECTDQSEQLEFF